MPSDSLWCQASGACWRTLRILRNFGYPPNGASCEKNNHSAPWNLQINLRMPLKFGFLIELQIAFPDSEQGTASDRRTQLVNEACLNGSQ